MRDTELDLTHEGRRHETGGRVTYRDVLVLARPKAVSRAATSALASGVSRLRTPGDEAVGPHERRSAAEPARVAERPCRLTPVGAFGEEDEAAPEQVERRAPVPESSVRRTRPGCPVSARGSSHLSSSTMPPKPPVGGITCTASPARNTRPSEACRVVRRRRPALHVLDLHGDARTASRTYRTQVGALMSSPMRRERAPFSSTVELTTRKPLCRSIEKRCRGSL